MRAYRLLFALAFLFTTCKTTQTATSSPSNPLDGIIRQYEQIGSSSERPSWVNLSDTSLQAQRTEISNLLVAIDKITPDQLSKNDRINLDVLQFSLEDQLYHLDFQSHLFPLNAEGGFLTGVLYRLQYYRIGDERDYDNYLHLLSTLPDYFEHRKAQMQRGQSLGKSSPKLVVRNCMSIIEQVLETDTESLFFFDPIKGQEARETEVGQLLKDKVLPAYVAFHDFLESDYLPKAPEKVGISGITDGKDFYEQRVRYFTTLDMTPKEVFETGQREVKRIRAEMEAIIAEVGFEGSFADFIEFLRTDEQFYAKTPAELMKEAAWITKRMEGKLPQYFNKLPRMPLTVSPVPASIAPTYTAGRYSRGSYGQRKAGQYWVNTFKLESRPLYALPALSLHEGVPGHHTQIMLAAEMDDIPDFRRNTYFSAFGEGWALYTEFLGKEAEMYETPYEDFGRLVYEMWRACRLVVDPGMHYFDWTRREAFDFMASNTALSLHEVNTEIDRYIGWPGQAVSYKIGELKIKELRRRAEQELASNFNIRSFHDFVLSNGAVPLRTLERLFEEWLDREKSA
ncbi:MAG: DUF885 domain-containing protein [Bacteroidota bacterium]